MTWEDRIKRDPKWQEVMEKTKQAFDHVREKEEKMKLNNGPMQVGDIFYLPNLPEECPLFFGIILHHPDNKGDKNNPLPDDLFFAVSMDDWDGMLGLCDVLERDNEYYGPVVARCSHGFWIARRDIPFNPERGKSLLGEDMVRRCQNKMNEIVNGKLTGHQGRWENEASPEYNDYLDELTKWHNMIIERIRQS